MPFELGLCMGGGETCLELQASSANGSDDNRGLASPMNKLELLFENNGW